MKKSKIIFLLVTGLTIFSCTSLVLAEQTNIKLDKPTIKISEPETNKDIEVIKNKLKKEIEERFNNNIQDRMFKIADEIGKDTASEKIKLSKASQDNLTIILNKINTKFNDKLNKLSIIDNKISLKIEGFEQEEKDVTAIKNQYDTAKTSLINTRIELLAVNNIVFDQISQKTSKDVLRKLIKKSEESIRNTGEEYRKLLPMFAKLEGDNSIKN